MTMPIGAVYQSADGTIIAANPAAERILGLTLDQMTGRKSIDPRWRAVREDGSPFPGEEHPAMAALKSGKPVSQVVMGVFHPAENRQKWILIDAVPQFRDGEKRPYQVYATFIDITSQKNAEAQLRRSEEKFKGLWESAPDGLITVNHEGNIQLVNSKTEELFGYSHHELEGKPIETLIPQRYREKHIQMRGSFFEALRVREMGKGVELFGLHKKGTEFPVEISLSYFHGSQGVSALAAVRDVTERKKAEQDLRESEERYFALLERTHDLIQSVDPEGRFTYVNESWRKTLGYTQDEVKNLNLFDIISPASRKHCADAFLRISEGEFIPFMEVEFMTKSGGTVLLEGSALPRKKGDNVIATQSFLRDITQRKMTELALEETSTRFRQMAENIEEVFWMFDCREQRIVYVSNAFEPIWGRSIADLLKDNSIYISSLAEADRPVMTDSLKKQAAGQRTEIEYRVIRPDGSVRWILDRSFPIFDKSGTLIRTTGIAADITERKLAEEAVRSREEQLRAIIHSQTNYVVRTDLDGIYTYVNDKFIEDFGYISVGRSIGEINSLESIAPHHHARTTEVVSRCLENPGKVYKVELDKPLEDGTLKTTLWEFICLVDAKGNPSEIQCMGLDITDRKRAEERLVKLSLAVEQSPVSVIITDVNGVIEYVNKEYCEVTGYTLEEVVGKNPKILNSGQKSPEEYKELWSTILNGKNWSGEFLNKKKNGELFWVSAFISPIVNTEGKITHFVSINEDITEQKKILEDLLLAKEKAEEMNKVKSFFFANMSHELRTPFVGILGFSEILAQEVTDPELLDLVNGIVRSSQRMMDTLQKILALTKLEFEPPKKNEEQVDAEKIITDAFKLFEQPAHAKGLAYRLQSFSRPFFIKTDGKIFSEILINLISNAVKYTLSGSVAVYTSVDKTASPPLLVIKVSDTGIGIPADKTDLIWREFRQVSEGLSRNFEGTGLGLSITKKYTEILGGDIRVESEPKKGSDFIFTLPLSDAAVTPAAAGPEAEQKQPEIVRPADTPKKRLLVVEDDENSQWFINRSLGKLFELEIVPDADSAMNLVIDGSFDGFLIDINLRYGLDGTGLMEILRRMPGYKNIPMIAITAYASDEDRDEFLSRGFSHYLAKPYTQASLINLVQEVFL